MRTIRILAFQGTAQDMQDIWIRPTALCSSLGMSASNPKRPVSMGCIPQSGLFRGLEATLQRLRGRRGQPKDMPGTIQDDTHVFHQAYDRAQNRPAKMRDLLVVYFIDYLCEDDRFEEIRSQLMEWYTKGTILRYGWPPVRSDTPFDNCVSIQRKLGMPITDFEWHQGLMDDYIKIFQATGHLWTPEGDEE